MTAIKKIEAQQAALKEGSAPWTVGEQLKEICEREPESAAILDKDLEVAGMSIVDAEKKLKAYADKHIVNKVACVSWKAADKILREFYGLPQAAEKPAEKPGGGVIDLADFL